MQWRDSHTPRIRLHLQYADLLCQPLLDGGKLTRPPMATRQDEEIQKTEDRVAHNH